MAMSVLTVNPILTNGILGIICGDASMSDGGTVLFRLLSRDPLTVRLMNRHEDRKIAAVIEAWLAKQ